MNLDITFCSKTNCKNLKCERNQKRLNELDYQVNHIWVGNMEDCKYWEDKNNQELKKLENVLKSFNNNRSTLQDKQENNQCFDCDSRML